MSLDIDIVETYIQRGIEEFDSSPLAAQLLRRLANEAPELFFKAATAHLNSPAESNAHRMLAIILLRQDDLFDRLASPSCGSQESAVRLFKRLLAVDPSFDVKLARRLPGRSYWNHAQAFDTLRSTRALEILDETSVGRRLLPILGHLPDCDDAKIAAKATLFVGKRVQNPAWSKRQLDRGDERIRANAIEALWGVNTPPATRLLEECAHDRNNRVVGNALVGLHIAGRADARRDLVNISRTGKAELRSTAAWAMGKIATPEFTPRLTELIRDDHPMVRGTALRALIQLRRLESETNKPLVSPVAEKAPEVIAVAVEEAANHIRIPSWAARGRR
jgi:HEAT repeat protein